MNQSNTPQSESEDHQHKFVIPVEWKFIPSEGHFDGAHVHGSWEDYKAPIGRVVTKLRCECGEEIER
jgi:hypothetical protein